MEAKRAYTNGTGLGHYSRTLICSLATYYPDNAYYLFTPRHTGRFDTGSFRNVHPVTPQHFPGSLFPSAWRSSWVKKDLKQKKIALYHGLSHEIPRGMPATGIPSVVTIHDLIFERYPRQYNPVDVQIYRKKFRYACQKADRILAISQQTKEDLLSFYQVPESKVDICYQSCNPAFSVPVTPAQQQLVKEKYGLPDTFFLYVGSIIERKNLLNICKALVLLRNETTLPLVVIGEGGRYREQVQQYVQEHGLVQRVRFLSYQPTASQPGFRSAEDFPAIYQQALCMVYPSVFEGFGIPVLEALCSRLPVVTSHLSCLPEAGGEGALYVDPYQVEEIADALLQITRSSHLRHTLAERGWQHAQSFTPQKCAAAVMQTYLRVV